MECMSNCWRRIKRSVRWRWNLRNTNIKFSCWENRSRIWKIVTKTNLTTWFLRRQILPAAELRRKSLHLNKRRLMLRNNCLKISCLLWKKKTRLYWFKIRVCVAKLSNWALLLVKRTGLLEYFSKRETILWRKFKKLAKIILPQSHYLPDLLL